MCLWLLPFMACSWNLILNLQSNFNSFLVIRISQEMRKLTLQLRLLISWSNLTVSANDQVSHFRRSLRIHWQTEWERKVLQTGKDCFLPRIKSVLSHWPWDGHQSRLVETVFAKLKVGHANVSEICIEVVKEYSTVHALY